MKFILGWIGFLLIESVYSLHISSKLVLRTPQTRVKCSSSADDSISDHLSLLKESISTLKRDKEKKQAELLAVDVAILQAQKEMQRLQNTNTKSNAVLDYGYQSKSWGSSVKTARGVRDSSVPPSALTLAIDSFQRELFSIVNGFKKKSATTEATSTATNDDLRSKIRKMTLSNANIWKREESDLQPVKTAWIIKAPYILLCLLLDVLFEGEPISRFYFLETVARMPYFSYITMLHTYETLGWWRRSTEAKRVHFAEEYNEYHHLLIWESLGGDQAWRVRFLAQHAAIVYFFVLIVLWTVSPTLAYNFSELIETHAVHTYSEFAESNKATLQSLPPPAIAIKYYESPDLYVFDEFQTQRDKGSRRVVVGSLYDAVCAIRDDEAEHVATMRQCQDPDVLIKSPNTEAAVAAVSIAGALAVYFATQQVELGLMDSTISEMASGAASKVTDALNEAGAIGREVWDSPAASGGLEEGAGMAEEVLEGNALRQLLIKILSVLRL